MSRRPILPSALKRGPFTIAEARREGLEPWRLKGASWKRVGPAIYLWIGLAETPLRKIQAALKRLPQGSVFSGLTAAWLHGLDVEPCDPIEVTVPVDVGVSSRAGIAVRRAVLKSSDVTTLRGMRATSLLRTVAEVCSRLDLIEAVVIADMALRMRRIGLADLAAWAGAHRGRGIRNFRRVISLAEPASESPMETRLRMVLVLSGLPRPRLQVPIHDRGGRFVGRPDMYYEDYGLGIEYDGGTHRSSLAEDNRRQNILLNAGVRLLRFTAGDVFDNPGSVVAQVRAAITPSVGRRIYATPLKRPNAGRGT